MDVKQLETAEFYKKLAHLFYAIAMADKKIVLEEKKIIIHFVEKYWSHKIHTLQSKEIIYEVLRGLQKNDTEAPVAFAIFKIYFLKNAKLFTKEYKKKIMETSDGIALSYSGKNKSELIILAKLHRLLWL